MKANLLIVDDDAGLRCALKDRVESWHHSTTEASGGREALDILAKREFDLVLLDLSMPDMSGIDVLRELRDTDYPGDVVVLTAHGSVEAAVEAVRLGAVDFLSKPADFELLRAKIDQSLEKRRLERENRALATQVERSVPAVGYESPVMTRLAETARRAAKADATVLITGESGVGKQVLAEFIHRESPRHAGPFVYVNCVAIPDQLMESELFGIEAGVATGVTFRKGRLEATNGGTAFLDEIGDFSPGLQTKLLQFLQTGQFERMGGRRTITVDCRIVTATNRNLAAAMREQKFRQDLYYRINVIPLNVPPLRERREDIQPLAEHFLSLLAPAGKRRRLRFAPRTLEMLRAYSWPGNVRQLKNAIEYMAAMALGETLTPDLLPPEVLAPAQAPASSEPDLSLEEAELRFRREYIVRTLARTGGNQTKAAELLGIQRAYLNRLIRELGLRATPAEPE